MGRLLNLIFGESTLDFHKRMEKKFKESEERMAFQLLAAIEQYNEKGREIRKR